MSGKTFYLGDGRLADTRSGESKKLDEIKYNARLAEVNRELARRSSMYTYLDTKYGFSNEGTGDEQRAFGNVIRALFGCPAFVDIMKIKSEEKFPSLFYDALKSIIIYEGEAKVDIGKLYKEYKNNLDVMKKQITGKITCKNIITKIAAIWERHPIYKKLFIITRSIIEYCIVCKKHGEIKDVPVAPFIVDNSKYNSSYDLEDSLYAERRRESYTCVYCSNITPYKLLITTNAPEIIAVSFSDTKSFVPWVIPDSLDIPVEERFTHRYALTSYIVTDKRERYVTVIRKESDIDVSLDRYKSVAESDFFNGRNFKFQLLLYSKISIIAEQRRTFE